MSGAVWLSDRAEEIVEQEQEDTETPSDTIIRIHKERETGGELKVSEGDMREAARDGAREAIEEVIR